MFFFNALCKGRALRFVAPPGPWATGRGLTGSTIRHTCNKAYGNTGISALYCCRHQRFASARVVTRRSEMRHSERRPLNWPRGIPSRCSRVCQSTRCRPNHRRCAASRTTYPEKTDWAAGADAATEKVSPGVSSDRRQTGQACRPAAAISIRHPAQMPWNLHPPICARSERTSRQTGHSSVGSTDGDPEGTGWAPTPAPLLEADVGRLGSEVAAGWARCRVVQGRVCGPMYPAHWRQHVLQLASFKWPHPCIHLVGSFTDGAARAVKGTPVSGGAPEQVPVIRTSKV